MVSGVSKGFERKLSLVGVGFSAQAQGPEAEPADWLLAPGREGHAGRHQGRVPDADRDRDQGADRQVVGQIAAEVRAIRPPEPYKGKGIRYAEEKVSLKETKKK